MMVLLVENEPNLSDALSYIVKKNNYCVNAYFDGIAGQAMANSDVYDLIILDRMLPDKEGSKVLKEIRKKGIKTPVLILTTKNSIKDNVEGLGNGSDDYLSKPFSMDALLAKLRVLSKRQTVSIKNEDIKLGSINFYPIKSEIECKGEVSKLTIKESQLLELLIENKNQVITKQQISEKLWGFTSTVNINSIEVCISYLRKKLNSIKCSIIIKTVRGIGYYLKEVN